MSPQPRMLEGERLLYRGTVYIVKGFQHPPGHVVAYPRYRLDAWPPRRILFPATRLIPWKCIGRRIPVIPVEKALPVPSSYMDTAAEALQSLLSMEASIGRGDLALTGSTGLWAAGPDSDIDIVVYGRDTGEAVYSALKRLRASGATKPLTGPPLLHEASKHPHLSPQEYMVLRQRSLLQGIFMNRGYSVRIVPYTRGYAGCVDRVVERRSYRGRVRILEALSPYTTPALYRIWAEGYGYIYLYTFKLLYTELREGLVLMVRGEIELSGNGDERLVIDHGEAHPLY